LVALTKVEIKIEQDPSRLRPSDVQLLTGSSEKFRKATGWKPEIPFDQTLKDLMDYWRTVLA
jgi:GDP-4-dehydro-6-deoxy-D-mannose reductase